ncbi:argininosuccinate lyase [Candidatus Kaiserbacteria bacterium]|nr:argininosuccinate lyase [Candidatus Kaiserbacteria bacterium]
MAKLWNKSGQVLHPLVEKYTAGTDHVFDHQLMPFDIDASAVHAKALKKADVLTASELKKILAALAALQKKFDQGKIKTTSADEDCHTVIENYLIKQLGDIGKKIHTGRSRNDQVLVATRLYMKHHLGMLQEKALALASSLVDVADKYKEIPMPGYSHTQQAMLSTVGHYMASYAESLIDDADFALKVLQHLDKNPLGSAAGFGTSIGIDRSITTKELGFGSIQINSLYCQNSRGKFESAYMEALAQIMLTLGKFANDLLIFTSQEFDFFSVDESVTTGSSIMPHKRNLDAMEILRGNVSVVIANQLMVKDIAKNLISGYNRDGQLIKKPLFESTQIALDSIEIVALVLKGLNPKTERIRAKINPGIFTADVANELVKKGMPFRDAYKKAATMIPLATDLEKNIASKKSVGAPGNLQLKQYRERIKQAQKKNT